MSNMSYCRFENTNNDLGDCVAAMEQVDTLADLDLNEYEARAVKWMAENAQEFLEHYARLTSA